VKKQSSDFTDDCEISSKTILCKTCSFVLVCERQSIEIEGRGVFLNEIFERIRRKRRGLKEELGGIYAVSFHVSCCEIVCLEDN
jgi:hypothetical protein